MKLRALIGQLTLAVLLTIVMKPTVVQACTVPPPPPPPVWIEDHNDGTAWIIVHSYDLFGAVPGQFCGCGFTSATTLPSVTSIDTVEIQLASTGATVANFSFSPNATTSSSFSALALNSIDGFSSALSSAVAAGIPVQLALRVTLAPGMTVNDLQSDIQSAGTFVVTDEVTAAGASTGNRIAVRPAGPVMIVGDVPSMSVPGTLALVALMIAASLAAARAISMRRTTA